VVRYARSCSAVGIRAYASPAPHYERAGVPRHVTSAAITGTHIFGENADRAMAAVLQRTATAQSASPSAGGRQAANSPINLTSDSIPMPALKRASGRLIGNPMICSSENRFFMSGIGLQYQTLLRTGDAVGTTRLNRGAPLDQDVSPAIVRRAHFHFLASPQSPK